MISISWEIPVHLRRKIGSLQFQHTRLNMEPAILDLNSQNSRRDGLVFTVQAKRGLHRRNAFIQTEQPSDVPSSQHERSGRLHALSLATVVDGAISSFSWATGVVSTAAAPRRKIRAPAEPFNVTEPFFTRSTPPSRSPTTVAT